MKKKKKMSTAQKVILSLVALTVFVIVAVALHNETQRASQISGDLVDRIYVPLDEDDVCFGPKQKEILNFFLKNYYPSGGNLVVLRIVDDDEDEERLKKYLSDAKTYLSSHSELKGAKVVIPEKYFNYNMNDSYLRVAIKNR